MVAFKYSVVNLMKNIDSTQNMLMVCKNGIQLANIFDLFRAIRRILIWPEHEFNDNLN